METPEVATGSIAVPSQTWTVGCSPDSTGMSGSKTGARAGVACAAATLSAAAVLPVVERGDSDAHSKARVVPATAPSTAYVRTADLATVG